MERGLQRIDRHQWQVTEPTPVQIGLPSRPPSAELLAEMREVCRMSGAREVFWFWIGIRDAPPHLGLAVIPFEPAVVSSIGERIEPLWRQDRPENPVFDIMPLDHSPLSETIRRTGRVLYREPSS